MINRILTIGFVLICCFTSCKKDKQVDPEAGYPVGDLKLVNSYNIDITEPSGLSFGPENKTLLVVSDNTNQVYEISFDGDIIRKLNYVGSDLEGVTYNSAENVIAITEERAREVVFIDYQSGLEVSRFSIDIESGSDNKGLEGISYSSNNNAYYIVNEDDPGELIVWNPELGIIQETVLSIAEDYSSVFIDNEMSLLWILSDESRALFMCDYKTNVLMEYKLDISKYEGVVVDYNQNTLFLVNDKTATLEKYTFENK